MTGNKQNGSFTAPATHERSEGTTDVQSLAWQMRKVQHRSMRSSSELLEKHGLHFGLPRLMHLIRKYPNTSQKDLAKQMLVTDPALSQSVKRLTKLGYVDSEPDPEDQRRKILRLTPLGVETLEECDRGLNAIYERLFVGFEEDDMRRLSRMLSAMTQNLE